MKRIAIILLSSIILIGNLNAEEKGVKLYLIKDVKLHIDTSWDGDSGKMEKEVQSILKKSIPELKINKDSKYTLDINIKRANELQGIFACQFFLRLIGFGFDKDLGDSLYTKEYWQYSYFGMCDNKGWDGLINDILTDGIKDLAVKRYSREK
ncbi:MAG: hypothetical protein LHV68_09780 [Elusimicrobia bacterium]|nr:hypothetical protein [Candidatus Liberimonas magnetica]